MSKAKRRIREQARGEEKMSEVERSWKFKGGEEKGRRRERELTSESTLKTFFMSVSSS